jgi:hypothetical protein
VVLVGPPHRSNRETLAARLAVPVLELPPIDVESAPLDTTREPLASLVRRLGELLAGASGAPR